MWLPSLKALRAVEAALRLGSFAAAARELGVTQTAISRLVKEAEAQLSQPLFARRANDLVPTETAMALRPGLAEAFRRLEATVAETRRRASGPTITLSVGPTFAMRWLIPRLTDFQQRHPKIDVHLSTSIAQAPEPPPDCTASIRLSDATPSGFDSDPLFSGRLLAVCRPDLASGLKKPADLKKFRLLDVHHAAEDWPLWLAAMDLPERDRFQTVLFDYSAFAVQAALDGLGVALAREPYVTDDLNSGRLAAPFKPLLPLPRRDWHLIYRPEARANPSFRTFRNWLLAVVKPTHAEPTAAGSRRVRHA